MLAADLPRAERSAISKVKEWRAEKAARCATVRPFLNPTPMKTIRKNAAIKRFQKQKAAVALEVRYAGDTGTTYSTIASALNMAADMRRRFVANRADRIALHTAKLQIASARRSRQSFGLPLPICENGYDPLSKFMIARRYFLQFSEEQSFVVPFMDVKTNQNITIFQDEMVSRWFRSPWTLMYYQRPDHDHPDYIFSNHRDAVEFKMWYC